MTVLGFKTRYGTWPVRMRVPLPAMRDLRLVVFFPTALRRVRQKLGVVVTGKHTMLTAEGPAGETFEYGRDGAVEGPATDVVEEWLGETPDRPHPGW